MGFFMDILNSLADQAVNRQIIRDMNDDDEYDNKYRNVALRNSSANNGWYTCPKCGKKFRQSDMDADHIIPQSRGGDNSRYNLQLLCQHCNRSKQDDMSDTMNDLNRRRNELKQQDEDDLAFLNEMSKKDRRK